jgi:polysaccharide biosynthesis protein PslJ
MSRINSATWDRAVRDLRGAGGARRLARPVMAWLATVVVAAGVAIAAVGNRKIGLALAGLVLVFGIFIADPLLLVVIALPGSLLIQRVGGASTNLSAADLLVFVGAVVSLFHIRWKEAPYLRQFMRGIVWYQAILVLVVVAHPFRDDIVEWFHRWSYIGGSVLVGWVIATNGRTKQAMRLFLAGSSLLALIAMEHAVTSHLQPAQWGVYQKNGIGAIMWVAVVVTQINPVWTGIGRTEARINKYLCIGGLLASQSRQSIILLILALALAAFLNPELRARSRMVILAAFPVTIALYFSFSIAARNNPQFNSVTARVDQISAAIQVWHLSPILGEGMRFYNLPQFITVTAPPNVLVDNLASSGIIGSLAFLFLVWVTVRTMFRLPYALGTLGLVILVFHYVDGLFDIFWIGASSIAPFIIAGISLGMADMDRMRRTRAAPRDLDPAATRPMAGTVGSSGWGASGWGSSGSSGSLGSSGSSGSSGSLGSAARGTLQAMGAAAVRAKHSLAQVLPAH